MNRQRNYIFLQISFIQMPQLLNWKYNYSFYAYVCVYMCQFEKSCLKFDIGFIPDIHHLINM